MRTRIGMWVRWVILRGVPGAFMRVQARLGYPEGRLLVGPQRGGDPDRRPRR